MKAYQLKIIIKETKPSIWRRVIVPAELSFSQLIVVINKAMDWYGYHLSGFTFRKLHIELEEEPEENFSSFAQNEILDASEYLIDEFLEEVKSFTYVYDFGDYWDHLIQI